MRLSRDTSANELDVIVVALLKRTQNGLCNCGALLSNGFQLTHKRYGVDIKLVDLELKCGACHATEHGRKSHTGTLRY